MSISERLKYFRQTAKMSTADISLQLGIAQNNYYGYENGTRGIPDDVYAKLYEAGCDLNWLIAGKSAGDDKKITITQNHQVGSISARQSEGNCSKCSIVNSLTEANKKLTEINEKLTNKLIDKI